MNLAHAPQRKPTLWILEDESALQFVYAEILENEYDLQFFSSLESFRKSAATDSSGCDLLVADLRLQDGNFLDFLASPDAHQLVRCPFIVVSSLDHQQTLRQCFNEGALDYLTKPFTAAELVVKVERLLQQRKSASSKDENGAGGIELDAAKLRVKWGTQDARLTAKELQIFSILHTAVGTAVSRRRLQAEVWGDAKVSHKSLDVHIFHLRRKLEKLGLQIECDLNGGFRLKVPETLSSSDPSLPDQKSSGRN